MSREGFEQARKARVLRPSSLKKIAKMELMDEKQINYAMETIGDAVAEFLAYIAYEKAYEILKNQWYGRMEPEYYERTYDLLTALNVTKDYRGHYNVGIDGRALTLTPKGEAGESGFQNLGQHMSFNDEPVASEIWTYVNYGNGNSAIPYEGIDIIGQVEEYLNSHAKTIVRKFLIDNGIPVK